MNKNSSIMCSVHQCRFHYNTEDYCTLNEINVGTHEKNPTVTECTDCQSFKVKSG